MSDTTTQLGEQAARFRTWLDAAIAQEIPPRVRAICFNLYETGQAFGIELIGAPAFDPDNADWACDEIFEYRRNCPELPIGLFGKAWPRCLEVVTQWVRDYLQAGDQAHELRSRDGVAVGFVDGELNVVWNALVEPRGRRTRS
jgi:hypothetical protein